jgi:hypothetical protein
MDTIINFLKSKKEVKDEAVTLPKDFIEARSELEARYGVDFTFKIIKAIHDNINLIKEN